jgi:hypothetical protein
VYVDRESRLFFPFGPGIRLHRDHPDEKGDELVGGGGTVKALGHRLEKKENMKNKLMYGWVHQCGMWAKIRSE